MQVVKICARIGPLSKTLSISAGYRPTLVVAGRKVFSSFERLEPASLAPASIGEAEIVVGWDRPMPCPLDEGKPFAILEGGREIGHGTVTRMISSESR